MLTSSFESWAAPWCFAHKEQMPQGFWSVSPLKKINNVLVLCQLLLAPEAIMILSIAHRTDFGFCLTWPPINTAFAVYSWEIQPHSFKLHNMAGCAKAVLERILEEQGLCWLSVWFSSHLHQSNSIDCSKLAPALLICWAADVTPEERSLGLLLRVEKTRY